ncbi:MAG: OmpA family protein, partial [bacterium]|nr:OmpA family protein [bacterium]
PCTPAPPTKSPAADTWQRCWGTEEHRGVPGGESEGWTDNAGGAASNQRLSQERADSVVTYLVDGGVDGTILTAVGFGEEQPIADNATAAGREQNRRIEFTVSPA